MIRDFRLGAATAPISIDTGASGGIALYRSALALPGIREALAEQGTTSYAGARGHAATKTFILRAPVGFGPFTLPAGQVVTVRDEEGSVDTRVGNVGNLFFAEITPRILFDYRGGRITFYRDCTARRESTARPIRVGHNHETIVAASCSSAEAAAREARRAARSLA